MKKTIISLFIMFLLSSVNALASKKNGVDLNLIDWDKTCPAVEAVTLEFPNGTCSGVHPTELEYYDSGVGGSVDKKPQCDKMQKRYEILTKKNIRYDNWKHCRMAFKVKYTFMLLTVDKYTDSEILSFRNKYLSSGIVDAHAMKRTRDTIREVQAEINRKKTQ
jgi:hypothetical protein